MRCKLEKVCAPIMRPDIPGQAKGFFLAYHGENDAKLKRKLAAAYLHYLASAAENEATVRRRVDRELAQLCLREDAALIFNSHSKFIRCMFRAELPDCAFARGKIANCGVVAVDVAIDKPAGRRLEAPELLFGGTFSSVDSRASLLEAIRRRRSRTDVSGG